MDPTWTCHMRPPNPKFDVGCFRIYRVFGFIGFRVVVLGSSGRTGVYLLQRALIPQTPAPQALNPKSFTLNQKP